MNRTTDPLAGIRPGQRLRVWGNGSDFKTHVAEEVTVLAVRHGIDGMVKVQPASGEPWWLTREDVERVEAVDPSTRRMM